MTDQGTKSNYPRIAGTPSVASRILTNPPINNHSTPHTTHFTPASALGGVAPPRGGETCRGPYRSAQDDTSQGSMSRGCSASSTRPGPWPGNAQGGGAVSSGCFFCMKISNMFENFAKIIYILRYG